MFASLFESDHSRSGLDPERLQQFLFEGIEKYQNLYRFLLTKKVASNIAVW